MPKKAGTQFLPFIDFLIKQGTITFEKIADESHVICFDCTSQDFINEASVRSISSKESAFLKNLSNYGFKKHDKEGNKKRYHCDKYQPDKIDLDWLIKRCKSANDTQNSKKAEKRKKNESGDSAKSAKTVKLGKVLDFGELEFESDFVEIQPNTITRNSNRSVFVANSRIQSNNTEELRYVKNLNKDIDVTAILNNDLESGNSSLFTEDMTVSDVQVLSDPKTVPLIDFEKLQRENEINKNEKEQLKNELLEEKRKNTILGNEKATLQHQIYELTNGPNVRILPDESAYGYAEEEQLFSNQDASGRHDWWN